MGRGLLGKDGGVRVDMIEIEIVDKIGRDRVGVDTIETAVIWDGL